MSLSDKARAAAQDYVTHINNKNLDALLDLFAPEGELLHPFGQFKGSEKLSEFYGGIVMHADTQLEVMSLTGENNRAVIELEAISPQAPDQKQFALDLFEVDADGKILSLRIYYRNDIS